jgi:hypothetical protein
LAASGTGNIPEFTAVNNTNVPQIANITVTASYKGCEGNSLTFSITVQPQTNMDGVQDIIVCNNGPVLETGFIATVLDTEFYWINDNPSIGLAASGTGNVPAFTAVNNTNVPHIANITVMASYKGCEGNSITFSITVQPQTNMDGVQDIIVCNNGPVLETGFIATVLDTEFYWINDNPSIGLAASGTGNIPAFTAVNNSNVSQIANITVMASYKGCEGNSITFTITVQPQTKMDDVQDIIVCYNDAVPETGFIASVLDTEFYWTNDNTSIGLPASGTGNIPAFTAVNGTDDTQIANITVTASYKGCEGNSITFTITVQPQTKVDDIQDITVCNYETIAEIVLTASINGSVIEWTNDNPSIGLPASGTGNIPAFTAINNSNVPQIANIQIVPVYKGCKGAPVYFTITVYPTATINPVEDIEVIEAEWCGAIIFNSPVQGVTYSWTNDTPSIGLPASGTGNIPAFVAINDSESNIVATIDVMVTYNGCDGIPISFTITVKPALVVKLKELPEICGDESSFLLGYTVLGNLLTYDLEFDDKALQAGFTNQADVIPTDNHLIEIHLPKNVRPDIYTVNIIFKSNKVSETISVEFVINYPTSVLKQKWNDVISLLNSDYNGGYEFSAYEWYVNDKKIDGATGSYLYIFGGELDFHSTYRARVTRVDDGVTLFTCPLIPLRHTDISVYPTLVFAGDDITIDIDIEADKNAIAEFWDVSGHKLKEVNLQVGKNKVRAPLAYGSYLLIVSSPDANIKHKSLIIVK